LLVLLGLAARFTALRRRITTLAEELLILGGKREGLPTIAAHKLLIFSHISLSYMFHVSAALEVLPRSLTFAVTGPVQSPMNSFGAFSVLATPNEFRLELPDWRSTLFGSRRGIRRTSVSPVLSGALEAQSAAGALPSPSVGFLRQTVEIRGEAEVDLFPAIHSIRQP
jgi:hypothetical protein